MNSRTALRSFLVVASAGLLSGCLGDAPPAPEVQPLEIVVGSSEGDPCLLNVDEVGAGTHDVMPVATADEATVRILDPSDAVLFERAVEPHPMEGGGQVVPMEDEGTVRLEAGDHQVECIVAGDTYSAVLRVVPARPGYEGAGSD